MKGISANLYKGLRGYWKRKGYKRLDNENNNNNNNNNDRHARVEAGSEGGPAQVRKKRRRFFRVKTTRKMRILRRVVGMPKKWLTRIRDAYVKMMLNLANSGLVVGGSATGFGGSVDNGYGLGIKCRAPLKEYDEKMIVEIYKSLVIAQGQIGGAAKINSQQQQLRSPPKITFSKR